MKTNIKFYISSTLFNLLKYKDISYITVSELSRKAKISRSSFYNNFNNISDVIDYKLDLIVNDILKIYKINKLRNKTIKEILLLSQSYIEKNNLDFLIIKNKFMKAFKDKLDYEFSKIVNDYETYIIKSGSFINVIFLFLENKIDNNELISIVKKI